MNIHRKNKKRILRKPHIVAITLLLIVLLYAGLALLQHWWPFLRATESTGTDSSKSNQENTQAQPKTNTDAKKDYVNSALENKDSGQQTAPDALISIAPYRYSDEVVVVSTQLGTVSDGTCTLTVTNGGKQDIQTADVIYQPIYSTCAGFSVPVSKLGKGTWSIVLKVETSGRQHSTSGTMVVN